MLSMAFAAERGFILVCFGFLMEYWREVQNRFFEYRTFRPDIQLVPYVLPPL